MFDFDGDGFWDLESEDFAILGGILGYAEEECEERMRLERELETDEQVEGEEIKEPQDKHSTQCCEPPDEFLDIPPDDEEPYP
ncbi:MAG: hypothetical protein JRI51_12750 [Deltaproteobacteria bacterium]|nr:hypothetical protein [Deltaproteobacteria bacterium]